MTTSKTKRSKGGVMGLDWFGIADNAGAPSADFGQFYSGMMQANQEFMDLIGQRCRAYMELPHRVSRCKSPEDVYETEMEFFSEAQDQYKEFVQRSSKGPFALPGAMLEGQNSQNKRKTRAKAAQKADGRKKGPARKKATRKASKRNLSENGSGVYSYPEHVSGRNEVRGRIH